MPFYFTKIVANKKFNKKLKWLMKKERTLKDKIFFTILVLVCYRIGSYIPVPVVDVNKLSAFMEMTSKGIFSVFNMFTGGSISRCSIFALGIMPYITASIIIQLIVATTPKLKEMKKEGGEAVYEKFNQYTKYLTLLIGFGQAMGISALLASVGISDANAMDFKITCSFTMLCGTFILIWFGNRITKNGIGNGGSLIIFTGIVAEAPKDIGNLLTMAKNGAISPIMIFVIFSVFCALMFVVVLFEKSHRLVYIQYPQQVQQYMQRNKQQMQNFLPFKVNPAGVIPPIFASAVILLPGTLANAFRSSDNVIIQFILRNFMHGTPVYILLEVVLIVFFSFFYNNVVFDAKDVADNLRKNNIFIPGTRPGEQTIQLFRSIMNRLSLIGAIYLSVVCIIPELFAVKYGYSFMIGGTSLLIVVNVITDTIVAIQTAMLPQKYATAMRKRYK